jgi:exonuclease VII small subunit
MGGLEERIKRLERSKPRPDPPERPITDARVMRELEILIERLQHHESMLQEVGEEAYEEGFDLPRYGGEPLQEHLARVDRLCAEMDAEYRRFEEWWQEYIRQHRPDLVERGPTELDEEIARLKADKAEIQAERAELGLELKEESDDG